jgi:hypothetical protein
MMTRLFVKSALVIAAIGSLASCGPRISPLTSAPPAKGLRVNEFSWGDGIFLKKFTFPGGVYQPQGQDRNGFYYFPQNNQVTVRDTGMRYGAKGGIYWKKDLPHPDQAFVDSWAGAALMKTTFSATPIR